MSKPKLLRTDDIRRMLEVKEYGKNKCKDSYAGSDCSDQSDLSTQSMPQYSSYRTLSGGLLGPFEDSPTKRTKSGFFHRSTEKLREMSGSRLKTPSSFAKPRGESLLRPSSAMSNETPTRPGMQREHSASRLPVYRREASMPQIKRESSIPQIKREKTDLNTMARQGISNISRMAPPTPRGTKNVIITQTTPKTVEQRKVSERNNAARGTRSGVSGISDTIMIGDSVKIKSSEKKGIVQFVGETRFAKGTWIGVVLEDATGKNDGSVGGVRYFTCPSMRGVFMREDKLEKLGVPRGSSSNLNTSSINRNDSALSTDSGVEEEQYLAIGDTVSISSTAGNRVGTLRFMGTTEFAKGTWCGVELNEPNGKNDGAVAGTRYFQCQPKHGIFAQANKVKKVSEKSRPVPTIAQQPAPPKQPARINSFNDSEVNEALQAMENSIADSTLSPDISNENINVEVTSTLTEKETVTAVLTRQVSSEHQENTLRLMNQIQSLEKSKKELENKVNDSTQKIEDLQFQLEEQLMLQDDDVKDGGDNNKHMNLENELKLKDAEIETLKSKITNFKSENKPPTDVINDYVAEESKKVLEEKEKEINEIKEQLKHVELKYQELESKQTNLTASEIEESFKSIEEKNKEVEDLKHQLKESREKCEELRFKHDGLEAQTGDASHLENEIVKLKQTNTDYETKVTAYENELQKLRGDIDLAEETRKTEQQFLKSESQIKVQEKEKEIEELKDALKKAVEQYEELKFKQDELEAEAGDVQKSNLEIIQLKELNRKHEEKVATYEAEVMKLKSDMQLLEQARQSEKQQMMKIEATLQELQAAASELDKVKGDNASLQGTIQVLKQEMKTISKELTNSKADKDFIEEELTLLKQEKEEIWKENEDRKKEIEETEVKWKDVLRQSLELQEQMKLLEVEKENLNKKCEELTSEHLQKSSDEVTELYKKNKEVGDQLSASEREVIALKSDLGEWKEKYEGEQAKLEAANKQLNEKSSEISNAQSVVTDLKTNLQQMSTERNAISCELNELKSSQEFLKEELDCVKQERDEMKSQKERLNGKYEEALVKIKKLEKLDEETKQEIMKIAELSEQRQQKSADDFNSLVKANTEKECKINCLEEELNTMAERVSLVESVNKEQRGELDLMSGELKSKINQLEVQSKLSQDTNSSVETLQAKIQKLSNELNETRSEKESMCSTIESMNNEKEELTKLKGEQEKQIGDAKNIISQGNEEFKTIKNQLENMIEENHRLEENLKLLTEQYVEKEAALISAKKECSQLTRNEKNTSQNLETKISELQQQLARSESNSTTRKTTIESLQLKVTELESQNKLLKTPTQSSDGLVSSTQYQELKNEMAEVMRVKEEKESEVSFLNSIIVDLQKKNKEFEDKIKILMYGDELATDSMNNTMSPPKPGLRVRSFCDICDVFDLHETEDCPLQSNDGNEGGTMNHGERGKERPYCVTCEMFGHTAENCDDEETF